MGGLLAISTLSSWYLLRGGGPEISDKRNIFYRRAHTRQDGISRSECMIYLACRMSVEATY